MLADAVLLDDFSLPDAATSRDSAGAIVAHVESMLCDSYARCEGPDEWWDSFVAFYQALELDEATRVLLDTKLDWIFCIHGETGWPAVRNRMRSHSEGPPAEEPATDP